MPARQDAEVRAGGCLCGAARYSVRGPLRAVLVCHGGQCRRWHGHLGAYTSAACAGVVFEECETLRWFATSARGGRGFSTCGSSLFFEPADEARLAIAAGSLDQPSGLTLVSHEFVADKADYVLINDGLPAFPRDFEAVGREEATHC